MTDGIGVGVGVITSFDVAGGTTTFLGITSVGGGLPESGGPNNDGPNNDAARMAAPMTNPMIQPLKLIGPLPG